MLTEGEANPKRNCLSRLSVSVSAFLIVFPGHSQIVANGLFPCPGERPGG